MSTVADTRTENSATPGFPFPEETGHRPVLLHPLIENLQPRPGQVVVAGTLGAGGVTAALRDGVLPGGRVLAIDRDPAAVRPRPERFAPPGGAVLLPDRDFSDPAR